MKDTITGLHHVTAITGDAQRNINFYRDTLGQRLVKVTVNYDDPLSYHLYYGDELGRPGSAMTFFVWAGARSGRIGWPQVTATAYAAPLGSLDFWKKRLADRDIEAGPVTERLGRKVLPLSDPDGLGLELVETERFGHEPWSGGGIAAEQALRDFAGVSLGLGDIRPTAALLVGQMGLKEGGEFAGGRRYEFANGVGFADLVAQPNGPRGTMGVGVVHHVAWRTHDEATQIAWQESLLQSGLQVSPVMERNYFRSIYFREPGGVLFEIATVGPGFTADEAAERLGKSVQLPPWLEGERAELLAALPKIDI